MSAHAHVIGAGLAGLSAALTLADAGRQVTVHEAGPAAGGRCRSYFDRELGLTIDNGNHLLLSGNQAAFAYIDAIGARAAFGGPTRPAFPFMDLGTGERWTVRPNAGRLPWWILAPNRRVPGSQARAYLRLMALARATDARAVAELVPAGVLRTRLIEPLAVAALNTPIETGLARLLGAVVRETLMRGGAACIPRVPRDGLSAALVDPALAALRARGAEILLGRRIVALTIEAGRLVAVRSADTVFQLAPEDAAVLAVPPWVATSLLPGLIAPDAFEAILNVHFKADADPGPAGFLGLIGGAAQWAFIKKGHVSVTISAASHVADLPAEDIAAAVWPDMRRALGLADPMPPWRVVKEKRATFAATEAQERLRPRGRTPIANLMLAGDWTATGLPATIEGAIRSGRFAANLLLAP